MSPKEAEKFPTIGTRGCFMSHLGVLRDAIQAGLEGILILEDDVNFASDFTERAPVVYTCGHVEGWSMFLRGPPDQSGAYLG